MVLLNIPLRFKNKAFWVAFIPAVLILIQAIAGIFGFTIDLSEWQGKLLAVVDAVFAVLVLIGVPLDFTTAGVSDSERVLDRDTPAPNATETIRYAQEEVEAMLGIAEERAISDEDRRGE